uniref:Ig-like domain-containing protein n=1 Tax=Macrostomum lignano TaxID=282301 RepID=A0A1I8FQ35_9PLAT
EAATALENKSQQKSQKKEGLVFHPPAGHLAPMLPATAPPPQTTDQCVKLHFSTVAQAATSDSGVTRAVASRGSFVQSLPYWLQRQHQVLPGGSVSACQASCRTVRRLLSTQIRAAASPRRDTSRMPEASAPMPAGTGEAAVHGPGADECCPKCAPAPTVARLQVPGGAAAVLGQLGLVQAAPAVPAASIRATRFREVSLTASRWQESLAVTHPDRPAGGRRRCRAGVPVPPGRSVLGRSPRLLGAVGAGETRRGAEPAAAGSPPRPGRIAANVAARPLLTSESAGGRPSTATCRWIIKWTETLGQSGQTSLTQFEKDSLPWSSPCRKLEGWTLLTLVTRCGPFAHYDDLIQLELQGVPPFTLATMQLPPAQPDRGLLKDRLSAAFGISSAVQLPEPPGHSVSISSAYWEAGDLRCR